MPRRAPAPKADTPTPGKPRVFVGSSTGALDIALAIQRNLEHDAFVTPWPQGVFKAGAYPLESLLKQLDEADFGVFVFLPEDPVKIKGKRRKAVRDNVLFEFGLFLGRLGRDRTLYIVPRNSPDLHVSSDLAGVVAAEFDPANPSLDSALGTACSQIRDLIRTHAKVPRMTAPTDPEVMPDLGAVVPKVRQIIQGKDRYSIKVIASTGGALFPALIDNADFPGHLDLAIQFVNPKHPQRKALPSHWPAESQHIINKLADFAALSKGRARVEAWIYDHVPCIHGVLVDGQHLFLGYYRWKQRRTSAELVGAQAPYYYYQRKVTTEDFFKVFEGWFSAPTCRRIELPRRRQPGR